MKTSIALVLILAGASFVAGKWAFGEEAGQREGRSWGRPDVAPVTLPKYAAECGSCHVAYPAGLLPARSWTRLMSSLDNHFGENAELAPATRTLLLDYLLSGAADRSGDRRSLKIMGLLAADATPLRITKTPYIAAKHREIPSYMIVGNEKVRSLSNCDACHAQASKGNFSEHQVRIPGYGRWDD